MTVPIKPQSILVPRRSGKALAAERLREAMAALMQDMVPGWCGTCRKTVNICLDDRLACPACGFTCRNLSEAEATAYRLGGADAVRQLVDG